MNETATVCYPGSEDEFTVLVNASIDVHGIIFSEVPFNAQFHTRYVGTLTNSETGFTVGDDGHITDFVYDDGESFLVRQAGLIFQIVVPGQGSVAADVGLITFDFSGGGEPVVTIHGPHDVFEQGYDAAICPALAG